ncbi:hypothetical protein L2737_05095 [Shewanella electrodiphila]|uniref:Uncharacterized protein n=1 Tax=Shewanella electrodiphila TaxID=934143 RepID=A0ABT0KLQ1_9GAMM|nr:hypothetical protein [Shewanella electrodiphila]MCL1044704.1 hypothetical protein [Shewanella electrodiphila]
MFEYSRWSRRKIAAGLRIITIPELANILIALTGVFLAYLGMQFEQTYTARQEEIKLIERAQRVEEVFTRMQSKLTSARLTRQEVMFEEAIIPFLLLDYIKKSKDSVGSPADRQVIYITLEEKINTIRLGHEKLRDDISLLSIHYSTYLPLMYQIFGSASLSHITAPKIEEQKYYEYMNQHSERITKFQKALHCPGFVEQGIILKGIESGYEGCLKLLESIERSNMEDTFPILDAITIVFPTNRNLLLEYSLINIDCKRQTEKSFESCYKEKISSE